MALPAFRQASRVMHRAHPVFEDNRSTLSPSATFVRPISCPHTAGPVFMKGTIININRVRRRLAVATRRGISLIRVLDFLDGKARMGDELEDDLDTLGVRRIQSTRGPVRVSIEGIVETNEEAAHWVWER